MSSILLICKKKKKKKKKKKQHGRITALRGDAKAGADPGFQVRCGALKKITPSGGRLENCWGISCEKSRFYAKKIIIFPILGGGRAPGAPPPPPPGSAPVRVSIFLHFHNLLFLISFWYCSVFVLFCFCFEKVVYSHFFNIII